VKTGTYTELIKQMEKVEKTHVKRLNETYNGTKDDDISEENDTSLNEAKSTRDYEINVDLKKGESANLVLYRYRWVVLASYFMSSAATGSLQGSLSTNREIYVQAFKGDGLTRTWL
jgi:hypothetical protein